MTSSSKSRISAEISESEEESMHCGLSFVFFGRSLDLFDLVFFVPSEKISSSESEVISSFISGYKLTPGSFLLELLTHILNLIWLLFRFLSSCWCFLISLSLFRCQRYPFLN